MDPSTADVGSAPVEPVRPPFWSKTRCTIAVLATAVPAGIIEAIYGEQPNLLHLPVMGAATLLILGWVRLDARQHVYRLRIATQILTLILPPLALAVYFIWHRRGWALLGLVGLMLLYVMAFGATSAMMGELTARQ